MRHITDNTQFTHKALVKLGAKFLKSFGCSVILTELVSANNSGEIPDVFAMKSGYSVILECKVSRSDFLADKKKIFRQSESSGMGQFRIFICPKGIISHDDLIGLYEGWGLLYVEPNNKIDKVIFPTGNCLGRNSSIKMFDANLHNERSLLSSALRRLQTVK